jgi:hypothetical protein
MTITPTNTDIKGGGGNYNHPGNKFYNTVVSTRRKSFVLAHNDTQTKNDIIQSIYDSVRKQSPPGRFLEKNKDGSYCIKSKEAACRKIKKALTENKAKIEEYFRLRGQFPPPVKNTSIQKTAMKKSIQIKSEVVLKKHHKHPQSV